MAVRAVVHAEEDQVGRLVFARRRVGAQAAFDDARDEAVAWLRSHADVNDA